MKLIKDSPEILFYIIIAEIALFVVGGIWHFAIGELFDFEYIAAVQNLGAVFSSICIVWVMRTFLKEVYSIFIDSIRSFFGRLGVSLLSISIVIVSYIIIIGLCNFGGALNISVNPVSYSNEGQFLFSFFITQIVVIITEEIIFRGFLLSLIVQKTKNLFFAILISSLVFGLGHFQYWFSLDLIMAIWMGIIYGILYIHYKSLYPAIFCHLGWNFSNNFFLINKNPLISVEYHGFLTSDLIRQFILLVISLFLIIMLRRKILSYFKTHEIIAQEE